MKGLCSGIARKCWNVDSIGLFNYTYDDTRSPFFLPPSFGRREKKGAEVDRVKWYSYIRGNQPRLASLVCPFQRKGRE